MDDIILFTRNEKELETLMHVFRIYTQHIWMEFGLEKCTMLIMKSGKWHMADGMELPNPDEIRTFREKETLKYLGILKLTPSNKWRWKKKLRMNISGQS